MGVRIEISTVAFHEASGTIVSVLGIHRDRSFTIYINCQLPKRILLFISNKGSHQKKNWKKAVRLTASIL